jgi:hypothetical protein
LAYAFENAGRPATLDGVTLKRLLYAANAHDTAGALTRIAAYLTFLEVSKFVLFCTAEYWHWVQAWWRAL